MCKPSKHKNGTEKYCISLRVVGESRSIFVVLFSYKSKI